ncbi:MULTISPECIES: hypothetical protein [unclassified Pseudoalteromonas]|uniref:hypothetical protein n=1 Tax=unclassified Pseudoalteromonas TaxID=194690 RepID=UPI002096F847|nr:hypothetical protein [Pseudoalteromonas sp. XMcav2-N]MCO7187904.1 hypothetical protein [Pseudoalteromonas sp. XMcav2-N]
MRKTVVVAISGASGCGKTSLVKVLSARFGCPGIFFDDYVDTRSYPRNLRQWHADGADVSKIKTPAMNKALELGFAGRPEYVFVEEPFGKARSSIASLIDYVVLLDLPLALCLSRVINRHFVLRQSDSSNALQDYLIKYQDHLKEIYADTVSMARRNCDLSITEALSVEACADTVVDWLQSLRV